MFLPWSASVLAGAAEALIARGGRRLLGLAGPPGAGKSTMAVLLCSALGDRATRVPMDGFHLANGVLDDLGLSDRKGSPPSFDAAGFQALLRRLRDNTEDVVYAPEFDRDLEEPIAGALPIRRDVPLVIVEGNYLLLDDGPWRGTADLFDQIWYLRQDETIRRERLVARHRHYGRTAQEAASWIAHNDEPNAQLIAATAGRADRVIVPDDGQPG